MSKNVKHTGFDDLSTLKAETRTCTACGDTVRVGTDELCSCVPDDIKAQLANIDTVMSAFHKVFGDGAKS